MHIPPVESRTYVYPDRGLTVLTPAEQLQRCRITDSDIEECHSMLRSAQPMTSIHDKRRRLFCIAVVRMVENTQPGDELWEFCTDEASWAALGGRWGLELVRDGHVIETQTLTKS